MKILQLVSDYLNTPLYKNLFNSLQLQCGVSSIVYVSTRSKDIDDKEDVIIADKKFNILERFLYFPKQKYIFNEVIRKINFNNIDCIHAHTLFSNGYLAYKIYEVMHIPYIVAVRNTDVYCFFEKMPHLRNLGLKILINAKYIIFLSNAYRDLVLKKYVPIAHQIELLNKSRVIPNGIDEIFLNNRPNMQHRIDKTGIKLLFVGKVDENKNLKNVITASRILFDKNINISLKVIGSVANKRMQKLLDDCIFIDHISHMDHKHLVNEFRNNDILVVPSYRETFGLVYAEAMSQGMPVIFSRGQGFDGQFPDKYIGCSVCPNNEKEIANSIEYICDNYDRLSTNCINNVNRYDWNNIAIQYNKIYESL